jgi:hypothetical protein
MKFLAHYKSPVSHVFMTYTYCGIYNSLFKFCVVTAVYHSFSMQDVRLKYFTFLAGYNAQYSASLYTMPVLLLIRNQGISVQIYNANT